MRVIGISAYYHDSAIAAVEDDRIRFAVHEERLSRRKHDAGFPVLGLAKALEECRWTIRDVDRIVFYERPELKLSRIYDQVLDGWPRTWGLFRHHLPRFYQRKYPVERILRDRIRFDGPVEFVEHHRSHAASAFYVSPFEKALVITVDGVGEYETVAVHLGDRNRLTKVASIHFPDSLGLLYSVFTQYLGFQVNEDEYKVMGLAPYGTPRYTDRILGSILNLDDDGSFHLDQRFFDFSNAERHFSPAFAKHLGIPPRARGGPVRPEHQDLAASIQAVLQVALRNLVGAMLTKYPHRQVCMAGGVALNCTANADLTRTFGLELFVQPAAGDAGGALGAAMDVAIRDLPQTHRFAFSPYLGTLTSDAVIKRTLDLNAIAHERPPRVSARIARELASGRIVAILHGREEWGPRALGHRSILADPRRAEMKDHLNAKIKFREEFRPFAPVVMEEHFATYFETFQQRSAPYMLMTHRANRAAEIPAAVHVDGTSRVQTVSRDQNPYLYDILAEFFALTGVPVLINTSFNLKGEPIVSTPSDALKTFFNSGIDDLVIEDYWISKETPHLQVSDESGRSPGVPARQENTTPLA